MTPKIRVAFIKFGGLSAGGTERWLQVMAANLDPRLFAVDYFYCDAAPYLGATFKHTDTSGERLRYMRDQGVNLIKFKVGAKDVNTPTHDWVDTDFWQLFDETKYDFVQTAKAGPAEYPYYLLKIPVIEYVTLSAGVDFSRNTVCTIHLSNWQRIEWFRAGGQLSKSTVIPIPVFKEKASDDLRASLGIPTEALVAGFHQRDDDALFSPIPLKAFGALENAARHFVIMGGGEKYRVQARELNLKNIHFVKHEARDAAISSFLNTLDIFAHGRIDGETFGTVLAEAMHHGKPCLSHHSAIANAQPETMGPGGLFAKDEAEYQLILERFFIDKPLRKSVGAKGLAHALAHYTIEKSAAHLEKVYHEIFASLQRPSKSIKLGGPGYGISPLGFLYPGVLEDRNDLAHHIFTGAVPHAGLVNAVSFLGRFFDKLISYDDVGQTLCSWAFLTQNSENKLVAHVSNDAHAVLAREVIRLNNYENRVTVNPSPNHEVGTEANLAPITPPASKTGGTTDAARTVLIQTVYLIQAAGADELRAVIRDFSHAHVYVWSSAAHDQVLNSGLNDVIRPNFNIWWLSPAGRWRAVDEKRASLPNRNGHSFFFALPKKDGSKFLGEFSEFTRRQRAELLKRAFITWAKKIKRQVRAFAGWWRARG